MTIFTYHPSCRICEGSLVDILNLGSIAVSDFVPNNKFMPQSIYLILSKCTLCDLVQLRHTVNQDEMYKTYYYQSHLNKSMVRALGEIYDKSLEHVSISTNDYVCDIGSNDGTLLNFFKSRTDHLVGIDPANVARGDGLEIFINDYFEKTNKEIPKCKLILSIAVFYDIEDPNGFVDKVKKLMTADGIWVIQFMDLLNMLKVAAFDNICHEHLEYYSLRVLSGLMKKHGLEIFDVEQNSVNGGSIRVCIARDGQRDLTDNVMKYLDEESQYMTSQGLLFEDFAFRVLERREKLLNFIEEQTTLGRTFAALGASTKGNTLLQYYGLSEKNVKFIGEVNPDKFGLRTVITDIPIISEKEAIRRSPDYFIVLPWHFIDNIKSKLSSYLNKGGRLVVPLPDVVIYGEKEATYL